jgi:dTDP-4-amino-4,6-dideoxygalactose transaminase
VSHTAVATVAAIELAQATPVLIDIDPSTYTIDVGRIEPAITPATKAILPVHLYGRPAEMDGICAIAKARKLLVIEDCAQAHGAFCGAKRAGSLGDIAAFSFYPTKNLGAVGDGGMIVTASADLAGQARILREYGWRQRHVSDRSGTNSRLDEIQAAILRVKLSGLDKENDLRRTIARTYDRVLAPLGYASAAAQNEGSHVYHQYVIQVDQRDRVRDLLLQKGIATAIHYPVPVHLQPAYRCLRCAGRMSVTERAAQHIISLPMFPELSVEDTVFVAESIRAIVGNIAA